MFDPKNWSTLPPIGADEETEEEKQKAFRAQIMQGLMAKATPQAPLDTSADEAAAQDAQRKAAAMRSVVQFSQALAGAQKADGANGYSDGLEGDAKQSLQKVLEMKRKRDAEDNQSHSLRQALGMRFMDNDDKARETEAAFGRQKTLQDDQQEFQGKEGEANRQNAIRLKGMDVENDKNKTGAIKKEIEDDRNIQKLSKDLASPQDMATALEDVEKMLGGKLEDYTAVKGNLVRDGKKVDLPGVSVKGIGRVTAHSGPARDLNAVVSKVFNQTLKDRSGSAVTNPELENLRKEFNAGKFDDESAMITALQRYKVALYKEFADREAAYKPELVKTYAERGGRTGNPAAAGKQIQAPTFPRKVFDAEGNEATVSNEEELKEANEGGFH